MDGHRDWSALACAPVSQLKFGEKMNSYRQLLSLSATILMFSAAPVQAQATPGKPPKPAATPQAAVPPQVRMPSPEAMIIMIRSSLVGLSHANLTNNYSVLNGLGSANFRQNNPPVKLAQTFETFRTNKIDLSPVVFLTPQLAQQPTIQANRLRLVGFFPSQPMRVNYDLMFEPEQGVWKLFGISVNLQRAVAQPTKPVQPNPAPIPPKR